MQITAERVRTLVRWCEYGYVVVLLFALTQGPVFTLWFASSVNVIGSSMNQVHVATFAALQLPALFLLGYRRLPRTSMVGPIGVLAAFCGWMVLTTAWATLGQHTIVEAMSLCLTCAAGLYFARSFSLFEQLVLVLVAMQPGLLLSRYAVANNWDRAVSIDGNWVGIYFNRNSLAPVAMVSLLVAAALMWLVFLRRDQRWSKIALFVLFDATLFAAVMLYRTSSNTSIGAGISFVVVWVFWTLIRYLHRTQRLQPGALHRAVYPAFVTGAAVLTWAGVQFQNTILGIFGETVDFNGRTALWRFSWTGFLERPIFGWGWLSAWRTPKFFTRDLWWTLNNMQWSHSGYMDVLLGGGFVGAALLVVAIVWGGSRHVDHAVTTPAGQWAPAIMFFVLAAATQESFFIGNHFLWLLLVAAIAGSLREKSPRALQ